MELAQMNKAGIIIELKRNSSAIKAFGVRSLGLFGSFVRDTATEKSDIDLLVEFDPKRKTFDNFMDLSLFLENLFMRKVELVTPQSLSKFIGPHILKEVENVAL